MNIRGTAVNTPWTDRYCCPNRFLYDSWDTSGAIPSAQRRLFQITVPPLELVLPRRPSPADGDATCVSRHGDSGEAGTGHATYYHPHTVICIVYRYSTHNSDYHKLRRSECMRFVYIQDNPVCQNGILRCCPLFPGAR